MGEGYAGLNSLLVYTTPESLREGLPKNSFAQPVVALMLVSTTEMS